VANGLAGDHLPHGTKTQLGAKTMKLCLLTLSAAVLTTAAMASDLPKEGKVSATYNAAGSWRQITAGKNLVAWIFEDSGFSVGETGTLFDHLTWHCIGVGSVVNGEVQGTKGNCVGTDPAGDQLFLDFAGDRNPADAKVISGKTTYVDGTGKYAGISGGNMYVLHGGEFKTAAEQTYVQYGLLEGSYKFK
jgi:hypothetical protein